LALGATARAAAARRAAEPDGPAVAREDLREAVREHKVGNLMILAVDASGSMGAPRRMEAAKGAVLGLLADAYQRRDRVALVAFRGQGAEVLLAPTASVEVAQARLGELPSGGRTPLAAGIHAALELAERARHGSGHRPLIVVVSDGRATEAPGGADPVQAALAAGAEVARRGIDSVVVDAEDGPTRLGLSAQLAQAMAARWLPLTDLTAPALRALIGT
jgi:magnesium chelatase subunit D